MNESTSLDIIREIIGNIPSLTDREFEVFSLMAQGYSNRGISRQLDISSRTVEVHARTILDKLTATLDLTGDDWNLRVACAAAHFYNQGQKSSHWLYRAGKTELALWTSAVGIAANAQPEVIKVKAQAIYKMLAEGPEESEDGR